MAIYDGQLGLLGERLHSQVELHARFGGVVPELASRDHVRKLAPLTGDLLAGCGLSFADLDGIAYTAGPGLAGALMVGAAFARALAFGLQIPAMIQQSCLPTSHCRLQCPIEDKRAQNVSLPYAARYLKDSLFVHHAHLVGTQSLQHGCLIVKQP